MIFRGQKSLQLLKSLVIPNLPNYFDTYVEPFSGTYSLGKFLYSKNLDTKFIYNDLENYNLDLNNTIFKYQLNYLSIIDLFDSKSTLFYVDPPYVNKEQWYNVKNSESFHQDLRDKLSTIQGKFIVHYQDHSLIRELYNNYEIIKYSGNNLRFTSEIIIRNYEK